MRVFRITTNSSSLKILVLCFLILVILFYYTFTSKNHVSAPKLYARHKIEFQNTNSGDGSEVVNSSLLLNQKMLDAIAEERRKLYAMKIAVQKEQQRLEEERKANELEAMGIAVKLGLQKFRDQEKPEQVSKSERQKYMDGLGPAKAEQFLGLDSQRVHKKFPGIAFLPEYRIHEFIDAADSNSLIMLGKPRSVTDVDDFLAEERFYELIGERHVECFDIRHMGNKEDGGWDICVSPPYEPTKDCLVYSFGINNDFTFDDAMMYGYGCHVMAFDPSMTIGDHMHNQKVWFYQLGMGETNTVNAKGWKLETLGTILDKAGHRQHVIDVLKIDIDYNEWTCFKTIFKESVLQNVKQLVLEIHTPEVYIIARESTREDFFSMYNTILELEKIGFRRFQIHYNHFGQYISLKSGKHRTCCYEFSYININFLKT